MRIQNRYTDADGDVKTEGSFKNSLYKNYIEPAEEKGAKPVLLTPIVRHEFDENGKVIDAHGHYDDAILQIYIISQVVKKQEFSMLCSRVQKRAIMVLITHTLITLEE